MEWYIDPTHADGPAVVRGHQIDGPGAMRFNGGIDQENYTGDWAVAPLLPALHLETVPNNVGTSLVVSGSYTRVQTPGCYAYQVDGLTFTEVTVFQVTFQ
ncbi:MAG TPA: hypothetical protein VIC85_08090 [Ktedonobacterales bacterium]